MRKILLSSLAIVFIVPCVFAQNKTLGVGTTTLNPNAALQVDAPNGNQGVLLPRLTTAQRTAMTLTAADKGLVVFDTDLNLIHTWNGSAWGNGTVSSLSQKLIFPYKDSLAVNPATGDALFHIINTSNQSYADVIKAVSRGTSGAAGSFIIRNGASSAPAVYGETNGTFSAGYFSVNNAISGGTALVGTTNSNLGGALAPVGVYGESTGTGSLGGAFWNTNATNTWPALYARTQGTGASFRSETSTGFASIFAIQSSSSANNNAIQGLHNGSGNGLAGLFQNTNAANIYPAIQAETAGVGHGVKVFQNTTSLGGGLGVFIQNPTSTGIGVTVDQQGLGNAGNFQINNTSNTNATIFASTNGTGAAISGEASGAGGAGFFIIKNATSNNTALYVGQEGTGVAIVGAKWSGQTGHSGHFINGNNSNAFGTLRAESSSNSASAFESIMTGTSSAGYFEINNAANGGPGIFSTTNGTGAAIQGQTDTGFAAIYGRRQGASNGNAGKFEITDASNSYPSLEANTVGSGSAGNFNINNAANSSTVLNAITNGIGSAGYFSITNSSNSVPALYAVTNGSGGAVVGTVTGSGNTIAGLFQTTNAANIYPALQAVVAGNNSNGIYVNHQGTGGNLIVLTNNDVAAARIDKTGKGFFNGGTQTGGADLAEMFDVEGNKNEYEPGDVLVISESTDRSIEKSNSPYSTKVAGVYATKPGVTLTEKDINESLDELVPMGVIGVIPTKVSLENGPIKRGDLLVTSSTKGHAMKAISKYGDGVFPSGVIIGKALENFDSQQTGVIKVLVSIK